MSVKFRVYDSDSSEILNGFIISTTIDDSEPLCIRVYLRKISYPVPLEVVEDFPSEYGV